MSSPEQHDCIKTFSLVCRQKLVKITFVPKQPQNTSLYMPAQGIMLLIWTSKVPHSNSDWNTGYPDLIFSWFSSVPLTTICKSVLIRTAVLRNSTVQQNIQFFAVSITDYL